MKSDARLMAGSLLAWSALLAGYCKHLLEVKEYGKIFKTGKRVKIKYVRGTEKAPYFGKRFQQDIEPHGRYMIHNPKPGDLPRGWESGTVTFNNPLVIAFNTVPGNHYDKNSWKARLAAEYKRKGKNLSKAIARKGYDAIVTVSVDNECRPIDTREIVDLTMFQTK